MQYSTPARAAVQSSYARQTHQWGTRGLRCISCTRRAQHLKAASKLHAQLRSRPGRAVGGRHGVRRRRLQWWFSSLSVCCCNLAFVPGLCKACARYYSRPTADHGIRNSVRTWKSRTWNSCCLSCAYRVRLKVTSVVTMCSGGKRAMRPAACNATCAVVQARDPYNSACTATDPRLSLVDAMCSSLHNVQQAGCLPVAVWQQS